MPENQVIQVETFACSGALGEAPNKPQVLLQPLADGSTSAVCRYRRGVLLGTKPEGERVAFFCTAEPSSLAKALGISTLNQLSDTVIDRIDEKAKIPQQEAQARRIISAYFPECPFQGTIPES